MELGNTVEPLLNQKLAEILREKGFIAESEQNVIDARSRRHQLDVVVDLDEFAIVLEAEFAPSDGRDDANRRLNQPKPLNWRGLPVTAALAISYPKELSQLPESAARERLENVRSLRVAYRQYSRQDSIKASSRYEWLQTDISSVSELTVYLQDHWIRTENSNEIDELVQKANVAIQDVCDLLHFQVPDHYFESLDGANTLASRALVWLNALLFQALLSQNLKIPDDHSACGMTIPSLDESNYVSNLLEHWREILDINWSPIFSCARDSLKALPPRYAQLAMEYLKPAALEIASSGLTRRHDLAGRIFHRLLDDRKFLATNYTTIPAAIILAGLAFDDNHSKWSEIDFQSLESLGSLRIVDPACGSGTLLMAAAQELFSKCRRADNPEEMTPRFRKVVLEETLFGYDVVPAALHLAASTISMSETSQLIEHMQLHRMAHDVKDGRARLGSLDRLSTSATKGQATVLGILDSDEELITGKGPKKEDAQFPHKSDVFIVNPPYTRAGGPGSSNFDEWNPLFGSVLSEPDQELMTKTLQSTLNGTPASLIAGLGSAFLVLADENIDIGGRLAFVLPAVALSGSRWQKVRQMLLSKYSIDWVISSHDPETRSARGDFPGRIYTSFSESTTLSEILLVATKRPSGLPARGITNFVNLRYNPRNPNEAKVLTQQLLSAPRVTPNAREIRVGANTWGEIYSVPQNQLTDGPWYQTTFIQTALNEIYHELRVTEEYHGVSIPLVEMIELFDLGPYHMQIKGRGTGLFDIVETTDQSRLGFPALWHHKAGSVNSLATQPNARLQKRSSKNENEQNRMLGRAGFLQLANELRLNTQSVSAAINAEPTLGVGSWITLKPKKPRPGLVETTCLALNTTLGMLLRLAHANRPYPSRVRLTHESTKCLPFFNLDLLSTKQLKQGRQIFNTLKDKKLTCFANLQNDEVRKELNERFYAQVLGLDPEMLLHLDALLAIEPSVRGK